MKYDAIVVGAGPAGLTAARIISTEGFKVAVFEKERHLSVKPCGEAFSQQTLDDALISPSKEFVAQKIKSAAIYAPNGKKVCLEEEAGAGFIVNKKLFIQHMSEKAVELGVNIFMNRAVVDIKHEGALVNVKTRGGESETDLILGADGFASTVSRKCGLEKTFSRELIPCLQYIMVNCDLSSPNTIEFYLGGKIAPLGYAWIFPKGERKANVGLGVRGRPAKPYLDRFIKQHSKTFSNAQIIGIESAPVTISGMADEIVDNNIMLVGEAAGQVIPLTGGGIHASIVGGRMAGETAVEALEERNFSKDKLRGYVDKYNKSWGKRIKDSLKALKVIEKLDDKDLNKLADLLEPQDILDLANGVNITRVGRKFMKHPIFSLKIARALLSLDS